MKVIARNSNQIEGALDVFAVPCVNVQSINAFKINLIDPDWFYKIEAATDSIDVVKELQQQKPGRLYNIDVSCFVPGTVSINEDTLDQLSPYKCIVVYKNTDGFFMRLGSKSVGLTLSYTHNTKDKIGYNIHFQGAITSPEKQCLPLYVIPVNAPKEYGCIYNVYAAFNIRGLAPEGYQLAMDNDWQELMLFIDPGAVGDENNAGNILKSCWQLNAPPPCGKSKHPRWDEGHIQGTDNHNFSALPAGMFFALSKDIPKQEGNAEKYEPYTPYKYQHKFYGEKAVFFSAITNPPIGENRIYDRNIFYNSQALFRSLYVLPNDLMSIRCIKTDPTDWSPGDTVTDIDGNIYNTVKIGDQVWMAANLKVKSYRNGEAIPNVSQMTADNQGAFALIV